MANVTGVVTIRWDVLPAKLAEVRRLSLYPFKPASTDLDAEMTANLEAVLVVPSVLINR